MPSSIIVFPSDLRSLTGKLAYPQIEFSVQGDAKNDNSITSIYLPMPKGVQFGDSGDYGTIELGSIAAGGGLDFLAGVAGGDWAGTTGAAADTAGQQISSTGVRLKSILLRTLPGVDKETSMFAMKKIKPPNQNTTFKGNTIRTFTFAFQLIARSQQDTDAIMRIHQTFRRYTYAGSSDDAPNVILDYPPLWKLRFLQGDIENKYMPKIFACYLDSFGCTFNQETNIVRYDGSPFDVSFSLSFKETRVLTRNDIDNLEAGSSDRGINTKTGLATSAAPAGTKAPQASPGTSTSPTQSNNSNAPTGSSGGILA